MNKIKIIRQHDSRDCGAACLCMISKYYKINCSIQYARKITETRQDGVTIWGLIEGAKKIGLIGSSYKGNIYDLKKYLSAHPFPLILHLKRNHFIVLSKIKKNTIIAYDPAYGKKKYTWEMIEDEWSGYIISFTKDEENDTIKTKKVANIKLLHLIQQNSKTLTLIAFWSILISIITFFSSYIFQLLIDHGGSINEVNEHSSTSGIIKIMLCISNNNLFLLFFIMIGMFIFWGCIYSIRGGLISSLARKIDITLIDQYVSKIFKATLHDLSSRMTGEYLTRITDLASVRKLISEVLISFCYDLFLITFSSIILYQINLVLFGLSIVMIVIYTIVFIIFNGLYKKTNYKIMSSNAEMQSFFKDSIQGFEVIKANNITSNIKKPLLEKYKTFTDYIYKGNLLSVFSNTLSIVTEQIGNIIIIFVGFWFVKHGKISLGELMSFYMILSCLLSPVKDILTLQPFIQSAIIAIDRVEDIFYLDEELQTNDLITLNKPIYSIEFNNVCFHYFGKEDLFSKFSMKIEGNKKLGIVGKNGAGKSTLIKLLLGFEQIDSGTIMINNQNIKSLNILDIRNKVSYIVQNNFLFADTIYNNITFREKNIPMEWIVECSKITGLLDVIDKFPLGFETYINENGDNLSVGQKQIIALTRALIRKPQLLILDEATSNMDYYKEQYVIDNILMLPIPCIIITHNHEILKKVDEIITL